MGSNTLSNLHALLLKYCYLYHCFDHYHFLISGFHYLLHLLDRLYFFLCLVRDDTVISSTSLMSRIYL